MKQGNVFEIHLQTRLIELLAICALCSKSDCTHVTLQLAGLHACVAGLFHNMYCQHVVYMMASVVLVELMSRRRFVTSMSKAIAMIRISQGRCLFTACTCNWL